MNASLPKAKAIAAVRHCGGDLTVRHLAELGLWHEEGAILGQVLELLGCVRRSGQGGGRHLSVSAAEAIERLNALPDDELTSPRDAADGIYEYEVLADPHRNWPQGTILTMAYVQRLLERADTNGLELRANTGTQWRAYQGKLYQLVEGDMQICEE